MVRLPQFNSKSTEALRDDAHTVESHSPVYSGSAKTPFASSCPLPKKSCACPQHKTLIEKCISSFCCSARYMALLSPDLEEKASARKDETIWQCGDEFLTLLRMQSDAIKHQSSDTELVIGICDDLLKIAYEKLYVFPFKDVPRCWMDLYLEASLLKFTAIATRKIWSEDQMQDLGKAPPFSEDQLDEMVKTMDMALIMTGPPPSTSTRESIKDVMDLLMECHIHSSKRNENEEIPEEGRALKRRKVNNSKADCFPTSGCTWELRPVSTLIVRVSERWNPSFEEFEITMRFPKEADLGPEPIIINGLLEDWPARNHHDWSHPQYLMSKTIGGRRLVPIETGKSYVDEGFGQKIVTFKEFMDQHILKGSSNSETGYLAQHNLFAQVPSLREDIFIPDLCYISPPGPHYSSPHAEQHSEVPRLEEPLMNAWFGPVGTTTPLHTDPYHNILAQVVGRKYVRLYAPRESRVLYAKGKEDEIDMSNTSELDIGILEGVDGTREDAEAANTEFPLFKEAKYYDCILEEGQCLYIPVGWWHYVRSLSVSFSVSFWFN
jgi:hypothetical protein